MIAGTSGPTPAAQHGRTALIVDDDEAVADLLSAILIDEGFAVQVAASGAEALAFSRLHDVHIVLFDYVMQDMNGADFYRQLRKLGISAPGILCSGWRDGGAIAAGLGVAFVEKPFDLDDLLEVVRGDSRSAE